MSKFDSLFEKSEEGLFWGLIARIESRSWSMDRVMDLPPQSAALVRLAFLETRYNNGGLLYVFECDRPGFGRMIVDALRLVGLVEGAEILAKSFALFPTQAEYDDWERRFATIARFRSEFELLDQALGAAVLQIGWAAGRHINTHRADYEYLRAFPPYDPATDSYEEDGSEAG